MRVDATSEPESVAEAASADDGARASPSSPVVPRAPLEGVPFLPGDVAGLHAWLVTATEGWDADDLWSLEAGLGAPLRRHLDEPDRTRIGDLWRAEVARFANARRTHPAGSARPM